MKEKKQKTYLILATGIALFVSITAILLISLFNSFAVNSYDIEQIEIANITTQTADLFWKGYSENNYFKILYKKSSSTSLYEEIEPSNVYVDTLYTEGYMFNVPLKELDPNSEYLIEIWDSNKKLVERKFSTLPVKDEVSLPDPIFGESFMADWIKITDSKNTYIVRADLEGRWSFDKNQLNENYITEIYSSKWITENNPIESLLTKRAIAAQEANCDEINYGGVDNSVKSAAGRVQTALKLNAPDTQYSKCYQDIYCEAQKAGVNPRWALTIWMNESNASSYSLSGADFGGTCCAPDYNFQAQLGFFLNLSHDPCGCGSGCSKEEYYCCWANNYYYGTKSKTCDTTSKAYIESVAFYYFLTANQILPSDFNTILSRLPKPIKSSGMNINCGSINPIEVYKNDGKIPDNGDNDDNTTQDSGGICCALKVTGNDKLRGDYENDTNKSCNEIWKEGRKIYNGTLEYSIELSNDYSRERCEKWWDGVCCENNGSYQWIPSVSCRKKASQFSTYASCIQATVPLIKEKISIEEGHNFVTWRLQDTSNPLKASKLLENPALIQVAGFHNGVWNQLMYKDDKDIKGSDFELIAGEVYLITATTDFDLINEGRKLSTSYSWSEKHGWQLVSARDLEPYSNTKSVVLTFDEVDITQVALWNIDLGKFNYYVYDNSGEEYGESVKFNDFQGVFVKIK